MTKPEDIIRFLYEPVPFPEPLTGKNALLRIADWLDTVDRMGYEAGVAPEPVEARSFGHTLRLIADDHILVRMKP